MPQMPMITRMLKTADPTIVPTPTSPFVINTAKSRRRKIKLKSCTRVLSATVYKLRVSQQKINTVIHLSVDTQRGWPDVFHVL